MFIFYFTLFIMIGKEMAIRAILHFMWGKKLSARTASREFNDVEDPGTVNKCVAPNWFRYFKEGDTNLKDKLMSGGPSTEEDEALLKMVEQQPR